MSGGCLGDVWWVSRGVWVIFVEIGGTRMCLGVSGFSVPAVWSRNTILSQPWNERIVCTWDIKIPKPPNIRFPKIIGFVQFLIFLVPSEKYYKLQSCWITLYYIFVHFANCHTLHSFALCIVFCRILHFALFFNWSSASMDGFSVLLKLHKYDLTK